MPEQMLRARALVVISRPLEEVFAYVSQPELHHEWQPELVHVKHHDRPGTAASIHEVRKMMGRRIEHRIDDIEHLPNHRISHKGGSETHSLERHWRFAASGRGTRVTFEITVYPKGEMPPVGRQVFERALRRDVEHALQHLKEILEAGDELRETLAELKPHPPSGSV